LFKTKNPKFSPKIFICRIVLLSTIFLITNWYYFENSLLNWHWNDIFRSIHLKCTDRVEGFPLLYKTWSTQGSKSTSGPDCSKHWIKLFTGEIIYGVIQWTTSVHWINMAVQKLSTGQKCFILAIMFTYWINLYHTKYDWTKVVQDKAFLSSGQLLNSHIYPVDRSCPLYYPIDDFSSE
jgi:hypothetical protein